MTESQFVPFGLKFLTQSSKLTATVSERISQCDLEQPFRTDDQNVSPRFSHDCQLLSLTAVKKKSHSVSVSSWCCTHNNSTAVMLCKVIYCCISLSDIVF